MILAAGRGERMRPLTDTCPKPMLQAGGKPLIAWHLEALAKAGFNHVVINHAHLGELIERGLGDGSQYGVDIAYSAEGTALETAGGIRKALPLLANGPDSEPFLVLNGDVYTDWPINHANTVLQAWSALRPDQRPLAHLVLVPNPEHNPKGDFYLTPNGTVHGDAEHSAHSAYTFSGIGVYQTSLFKDLPLNEPAKLAPLLRQAMAQGRVTGELHLGLWLDIGTPARLNDLNEYLNHKVEMKEMPKESPAS
ncbi:MAG: nucleotidyltransferase family protein [Limnobacter sp.]|nr:nucleotidyltransferase family protein [Limnobacter sp.]